MIKKSQLLYRPQIGPNLPFKIATRRGYSLSVAPWVKVNRDISRLQSIVRHVWQRSSATTSKREPRNARVHPMALNACQCIRRLQSRKRRVTFRERRRGRGEWTGMNERMHANATFVTRVKRAGRHVPIHPRARGLRSSATNPFLSPSLSLSFSFSLFLCLSSSRAHSFATEY